MSGVQSIIQKRKGPVVFQEAALNRPAWHHLLMGHRLTCRSPSPRRRLHSSCTGGLLSALPLLGRVNNYSMTTPLCELEGCLHKEKEGVF